MNVERVLHHDVALALTDQFTMLADELLSNAKNNKCFLIHVGITNFERSYAFYSAVMSELGFELKFCSREKSWAGWIAPGQERPIFFIGLPYDRQPVNAGNGGMTAFLASTREIVDRCYAVALGMGSRSEGMPELRLHYHPNYYGAYFRDPDGNKICVCCHEPASA